MRWLSQNILLFFCLSFWGWGAPAVAGPPGPERIVSLKPNLTEILFALGLGGKVVGVTNYCKFPPEAQRLPKIGGYSNPSLEKVLALHPDLVVMIPDATSPKFEAAVRRAGIQTLVVKATTLNDLYQSVQTIASRTGVEKSGRALVQKMEGEIEREAERVAGLPRKKGLIVIQRQPFIAAGRGTFLDELLRLAGGDNLAAVSSLPYPQIGMETVLAGRPEVIFDLDPAPAGDFWSHFPSLPAVLSGAVARLNPDLFLLGPRLPEGLAQLIHTLHHEVP